MKRYAVALIAVLSLWGCSDDPAGPSGPQISMTSHYREAAWSSAAPKAPASPRGPMAVDSLRITRARFVLRDVEFKSLTDTADLRTKPFVMEFSVAGEVRFVGGVTVPPGVYDEVEYDVHRVDSSDLEGLSSAETALFADFLADERYSIIVDGVVYRDGDTGSLFRFRSKIDAQQKHVLTIPLIVSEANRERNVTLAVSSYGWFRNSGGALLDPADPVDQSVIDENLKSSIRVYKDDNRDGAADL